MNVLASSRAAVTPAAAPATQAPAAHRSILKDLAVSAAAGGIGMGIVARDARMGLLGAGLGVGAGLLSHLMLDPNSNLQHRVFTAGVVGLAAPAALAGWGMLMVKSDGGFGTAMMMLIAGGVAAATLPAAIAVAAT